MLRNVIVFTLCYHLIINIGLIKVASLLTGKDITTVPPQNPQRLKRFAATTTAAAHSWTESLKFESISPPNALAQVDPKLSLESRLKTFMQKTFDRLKKDFRFVRKNKTVLNRRKEGRPPDFDEGIVQGHGGNLDKEQSTNILIDHNDASNSNNDVAIPKFRQDDIEIPNTFRRQHKGRNRHKRHTCHGNCRRYNSRKRHSHDSGYRIRKPTFHKNLKKQIKQKIHRYESYMRNLDELKKPEKIEQHHNIARMRHRSRKHKARKRHHKRKSQKRKHHRRRRHRNSRRSRHKSHKLRSEGSEDSVSGILNRRFKVVNKNLHRHKRPKRDSDNINDNRYISNHNIQESGFKFKSNDPKDIVSESNAFQVKQVYDEPNSKHNNYRKKIRHDSTSYRRFISLPVDTNKYDVFIEEYNSNSTGKTSTPKPFLKPIQKHLFKQIKDLSYSIVKNVNSMASHISQFGKNFTSSSKANLTFGTIPNDEYIVTVL